MRSNHDIDLMLTLNPHGWSTCFIYVNGKSHELTISHTFGDPIFDFINALSKLIKGQIPTDVFWYGEPGGERISFNRIKDRMDTINIKIDGFNESYGNEIKDYNKTLEFNIKINQLLTICYLQLKKTALLLSDKSFNEPRSGIFPFSQFKQFELEVKEYLKLD